MRTAEQPPLPAAQRPSLTDTVPPGTSVSIVMPCLNEEETVGVCVRKGLDWLARSGLPGEVLVIDNGSSDRSVELATEAGARVIHEAVRGYGAALSRGFDEAAGDYLVMGDCDDTYDFSDLDDLVRPLGEGYDMVVGNRFAGGIRPGAMTWSHRYIGTPVITTLIRVFAGIRVGDSQCGLRALTRETAQRLEMRSEGMEFASEMILKASRRGMRVAEAPIAYYERLGEAKLRTVRDGWRHLRFLLMASPNYLYTVPGLVLAIAGMVILGLALPSQQGIEVGTMRWQPVFAGSIFLVIGANAVLLGFASRLYTTARGITPEDRVLRFYRRYLGLESLLAAGIVLVVVGVSLDIYLAFGGPGEASGPSRIDMAALAQSALLVGANVVLTAFLASMMED